MLCLDKFQSGYGGDLNSFWAEIHSKLKYLVGRPQLSVNDYPNNISEDVLFYLQDCSDEAFLDFVELIFKTNAHSRTGDGTAFDLVEQINNAFLFDDLPYALTKFVHERQTRTYYQSEQTYEANVVVAFPQVIRRENEVAYTEIIEPALTLLSNKQFTSANVEFLEALADYRKGDFGDCLTKCGSAFESTMKIICDRKKIPYEMKDTAKPLVDKLLKETPNLESYFEPLLMIVATLRNKLSKSHGAGTQQRTVPPHIAKYALNMTASTILLLVDEFSP